MVTEKEYIENARRLFLADMARAERAKPGEKRKAKAKWVAALTGDPELVAERVAWLLAGHYGKGAYDAACLAVESDFVKPTFALLAIIAVLEWDLPNRMFLSSWSLVPPTSTQAVLDLVEHVTSEVRKARAEDL